MTPSTFSSPAALRQSATAVGLNLPSQILTVAPAALSASVTPTPTAWITGTWSPRATKVNFLPLRSTGLPIGVTFGQVGALAQPAMDSLACWTPAVPAAVASALTGAVFSPAPQAPRRDTARALAASARAGRERKRGRDMVRLLCRAVSCGAGSGHGGPRMLAPDFHVVLATEKQRERFCAMGLAELLV